MFQKFDLEDLGLIKRTPDGRKTSCKMALHNGRRCTASAIACIALLFLGLSFDGGESRALSSATSQSFYVSLTPKGSVDTYYHRFATPTAQVVVTDDAPQSALKSIKLQKKAGFKLYFIEPNAKNQPPMATEIAAIGGMRVIALPNWAFGPHDFMQTHSFYAEEILLNSPFERKNRPGTSDQPRSSRGFSESETRAALTEARSRLTRGSLGSRNQEIMVDEEFLKTRLAILSGSESFRLNGETLRIEERGSDDGRLLARRFLTSEYESLGYEVRQEPYTQGFRSGTNLIAERQAVGTEDFVLVTAHYDSVRNAGADDNGSGTITTLGVAKALSALPLNVGVRFVAFDQEELGLIGSRAYAKQLQDLGSLDHVVGVVNIEMSGFDGDNDGAFHVIDCGENSSPDITAVFAQELEQDPMGLSVEAACTNRSDHASFWRYDRPAVVVSQNFFGGDGNPCYHRRCDNDSQINYDYMTRLTTVIARSVWRLVGAE